jgi:hypothetical protein
MANPISIIPATSIAGFCKFFLEAISPLKIVDFVQKDIINNAISKC